VGPKAVLDAVVNRKIPSPRRESNVGNEIEQGRHAPVQVAIAELLCVTRRSRVYRPIILISLLDRYIFILLKMKQSELLRTFKHLLPFFMFSSLHLGQ
jgi:hypothetical protein